MTALTPLRELPLAVASEEPLWSENYCFTANDPVRRTGFWLHQSRMSFDPDVWREVMLHFRPDGSFIASKMFGVSQSPRGPAAAALSFQYDTSAMEWSLVFRGAAMQHQVEVSRRGAVRDGAYVPFSFDLTARPVAPVWDLHESLPDQPFAREHYECMERVTGTITIDGRTEDFDGHGIRDHSRGPRDVGRIARHSWVHGWFPSGVAFGVFAMEPVDPTADHLESAYVSDSGGFSTVTVQKPPMLENGSELGSSLGIQLERSGELLSITGSRTAVIPVGLIAPNEFVIGQPGTPGTLQCFEALVDFEYNGERGWGLAEQSVR